MTEAIQLQLRREILYFQEYRRLSKDAKKERLDEDEARELVDYYDARLRGLAEIDNSVWDLDSRKNHVVVHDDPMCGRPMVANFEGNLEKGSARIFLLDEVRYFENYLYADGACVDSLDLRFEEKGWVLAATQVDRFHERDNFQQKLIFPLPPPYHP